MCYAQVIIGAVSTAASLYAAQQQANNQGRVADANAKIATSSALSNYSAIQERQVQENARAAEAIQRAHAAATAAGATARVSAGESGVSGFSVSAVQEDFLRQEADYTHSVVRNQAFLSDQLSAELKAQESNLAGNLLKGYAPPPPYLNIAIQGIASTALSAYDAYSKAHPNTGT
jgi:hypothetical protein